jgi:bifunctional UDP-N-acetylglucosamine pyrophosphorylase/glucosamine-1-phosphate N-acetyltransferase
MIDIIILAAGKGTRMRSNRPKVLHELAGRPLLAHVLDTAKVLSPRAIHVVVGHGAAEVQQVFKDDNLHFHIQSEQLGTGHAVRQALPACHPDSAVLVLFGDVPLLRPETLSPLLTNLPSSLTLLTTKLDHPEGYGRVLRDAQGQFLGIVEQKDATEEQLRVQEINTGVLGGPVSLVSSLLAEVTNDNAQGEYYLPDLLGLGVRRGYDIAVHCVADATQTLGVNDRAQLEAAERTYQDRQAAALLSAGATLADRARIDVRGTVTVGADVYIDANVLFIGRVVLGDGVTIGANSVIIDSQIGEDSTVKPFSHLEGARIAAGCDIGPFARIRPGSVLDNGAKVGNFVEVKNTHLGAGSKANHLAYLGDAELGDGCNIGAGTITCNYDGANKHRTELGDGVFVGSNSTLVAPVQLASGAFVAAGSTVTKNVADKQLAVARGKQRNIEGWTRPQKKES